MAYTNTQYSYCLYVSNTLTYILYFFTKYPYYKHKKDLDIVEKVYVFIRIYAITPNSKFGKKSPSSITGVGSFFGHMDFAAMLLIFLVKTQTQTTSLKMNTKVAKHSKVQQRLDGKKTL